MIRSFLLILNPPRQWDAILRSGRSALGIWLVFVLPTSLICCSVESFGLVQLGYKPSHAGLAIGQTVTVSVEKALDYGFSQVIGSHLAILLCSLMLHLQVTGFRRFHEFTPSFQLMAYCFGPIFLGRLLDTAPGLPSYACWGMGVVLSLRVLYSGMVKVIRPDPSKALGFYFLTALMLVGISGLVHFLNVQILEDRIPIHFFTL